MNNYIRKICYLPFYTSLQKDIKSEYILTIMNYKQTVRTSSICKRTPPPKAYKLTKTSLLVVLCN